jgi:TM2 domain-containing membrane protein YozV
LEFCKEDVDYDVAVAVSNESSLKKVIKAQEEAAVTTYFYHLAALGMEAWDYPTGASDRSLAGSSCAAATKSMVCNTYFPRAPSGCNAGQSISYSKPCKPLCNKYLESCNVQCCDESVTCSLGGTQSECPYESEDKSTALLQRSGAAVRRSSGLVFLVSLALPLLASSTEVPGTATVLPLSLFLAMGTMGHGFDVEAMFELSGFHGTAAWAKHGSYFTDFAYIPEGRPVAEAVLNSCALPGLPKEQYCSGHGICMEWNNTRKQPFPLKFCVCDKAYADPECRTLRKSQRTAFFLSMFGGFLGLDRFYLGNYYSGLAKLSTLGGFGAWWIYDIVRIGSAPVYAANYRLAEDLNRLVYVVCVAAYATTLGFLFTFGASVQKRQRAKAQLFRKAEQAFIKSASATVDIDAKDAIYGGPQLESNYGQPIPVCPVAYGAMADLHSHGAP